MSRQESVDELADPVALVVNLEQRVEVIDLFRAVLLDVDQIEDYYQHCVVDQQRSSVRNVKINVDYYCCPDEDVHDEALEDVEETLGY
jgi:hypothetical protein